MMPDQPRKPLNARVAAKIKLLKTLIEHSGTSEEERDAARRALDRIAEVYDIHTRRDDGPGMLYNPGAWAGEKYWATSRLTLTEIAKLIRADLKMARKIGQETASTPGAVAVADAIGDAPREIKFSVRTRYFSGGGSIDVTIKNVPAEWGWTTQLDQWGDPVRIATPAMAALYRAVEKIHNAYNYCNSDSMTDYFERNYWGSVETEKYIRIPRE